MMESKTEHVLNLGCGEDVEGDVRFDLSRRWKPDVQGTATKLPFVDKTFTHIIADQVLEHLNPDEVVSVMNEVYRVLQADGTFEVYVPHASSRLSYQDPTHRSTWTFRSIDYFTDGKFAWYFDNQPFEFELVQRELNLWVQPERFFSGLRSKKLQLLHRLLGTEDEYAYRSDVDGSLHFIIKKL